MTSCRHTSTPWLGATVVLVIGLGSAATGWHYREHVFWRWQLNRLELPQMQTIPDHPMPKTPIPTNWVRCRAGRIEFSLPPELATNRVVSNNEGASVVFQDESRTVIVGVPWDMRNLPLLNAANALSPRSQPFTLPTLRLVLYQSSFDDFRWSMTREELRWHVFCMTTGKLLRLNGSLKYTESVCPTAMNRVAHFYEGRAILDWQCLDTAFGGYMHFIEHAETVEPGWIRAVSQSLSVLSEGDTEGSAYPTE